MKSIALEKEKTCYQCNLSFKLRQNHSYYNRTCYLWKL